jgi:hypothetical protein
VAGIQDATAGDLTFVANSKYESAIAAVSGLQQDGIAQLG